MENLSLTDLHLMLLSIFSLYLLVQWGRVTLRYQCNPSEVQGVRQASLRAANPGLLTCNTAPGVFSTSRSVFPSGFEEQLSSDTQTLLCLSPQWNISAAGRMFPSPGADLLAPIMKPQ